MIEHRARRRRSGARDAGKPGLDDGHKPIEIDGLGDIVVGPQAAAFEFVVPAGQCSQEYKRYLAETGAQFLQRLEHLKAGHDRHPDVAQDEVRRRRHQRLQSFPATVSDDDLEPALDQLFGDQGGGFIVIFDAKDFLARIRHASVHPKA